MALKLLFKYKREDHGIGTEYDVDLQVKQNLKNILEAKGITISHMYKPSRYSLKVIFPTEADIDKVMEHEEEIKAENFEPRMSLSLKACRTIFCTNFDATLLDTYTKTHIMDLLKLKKWKVKDVYIMKSNKSFKIEMTSRKQAQAFLKEKSINIGGIQLSSNSKEPEIDPTIRQCWECGVLNPSHNSQGCTGTHICIKCGIRGHKFYECDIPKEENEMTEEQKRKRFCAACGTRGTHTTLDHRQCQKKREILRERARIEREKRVASNEANNRDEELIRKVININNNEEFPSLVNQNPQQTAITTIITLALIDEANTQGVFEKKLEDSLKNNGLPIVKYKLEPDTAKKFQKMLCGAQVTEKKNTSSPMLSRYFADQTRYKRNAEMEESNENLSNVAQTQTDSKVRKVANNIGTKIKGATAAAVSNENEMECENAKSEQNSVKSQSQALKEQMYNQLKQELDKKWIVIESDINDEKLRKYSLEHLLAILTDGDSPLLNKKEWIIMIRALTERLIELGLKDLTMQVRIRKVTKDSDEYETPQDFQIKK